MSSAAYKLGALQAQTDFYKLSGQMPSGELVDFLNKLPKLKKPTRENSASSNRLDKSVSWAAPISLDPNVAGLDATGRSSF